MTTSKLTKQQQAYLVSGLKDVVDNHEAFEVDVNNYDEVLALLTEIFNYDWQTSVSEDDIDDCLAEYFKKVLTA